jgi:glycosyltransferase involved in cell wall biosynthesis
VLARSDVTVLSSRAEGGPGVVSEALALGVPILSARIDGAVGILGSDHPGYFPVGDTAALARLLRRAETDHAFLAKLRAACDRRAPLVAPEREIAARQSLLGDLR